jgi:hypothetical protein
MPISVPRNCGAVLGSLPKNNRHGVDSVLYIGIGMKLYNVGSHVCIHNQRIQNMLQHFYGQVANLFWAVIQI